MEYFSTPIPHARLEIKAGADGATEVSGYGSLFGPPADSYGDVVSPGAFSKTIAEWRQRPWPLPMLFNHDTNALVGGWDSLAEDAHGLRVSGRLTPGSSLAADVAANLRAGMLSGLSIGFRDRGSTPQKGGGRLLQEIELFEISHVVAPAVEAARVISVKSLDQYQTTNDFAELLRAAGWPSEKAAAIARDGFKTFQIEHDAADADMAAHLARLIKTHITSTAGRPSWLDLTSLNAKSAESETAGAPFRPRPLRTPTRCSPPLRRA